MRKIAFLVLISVAISGCTSFGFCKKQPLDYSSTEVLFSDFAYKITAYYAEKNQIIPEDFNENEFIRILEEVYPDKVTVENVKKDYKIQARQIGQYYSVIVCKPDTGAKLMEDFSCSLNHVDIRYWDRKDSTQCDFEKEWQSYCR